MTYCGEGKVGKFIDDTHTVNDMKVDDTRNDDTPNDTKIDDT